MPTLERPKHTCSIRLPPRDALVAAHADVLVVGGGPAGLGAALGAARAGAKVVLAERYGFLGGNATAALVMPLMSSHSRRGGPAERKARPLMPADHGPGEALVGGVLSALVERMAAMGGAGPATEETGFTVPFDPEVLKCAGADLLCEAGVELLLHAFASGVVETPHSADGAGRSGGVVFETKSGPIVVGAETIVDCTGDGDIAASAGADFEVGREEDGLVQPMSLMFRLAAFDEDAFCRWTAHNPEQWRGVYGLWDLVREAKQRGELDVPRDDLLLFRGQREGEVVVNGTRVGGVLGVDVFDLTKAEMLARRQMRAIVGLLRRRLPGFEESYLLQSGSCVGVRESRRIVGDYHLEVEDVLKARKFPDAIARCAYPIDIHDPLGTGTRLERVPDGDCYEIPLRCLLPSGVEGVLVAGRCISGSHEAHSSYRVMPISIATGQAAGVCAAIAARGKKKPRTVDARCVQAELVRQGCLLGESAAKAECRRCFDCRVA